VEENTAINIICKMCMQISWYSHRHNYKYNLLTITIRVRLKS